MNVGGQSAWVQLKQIADLNKKTTVAEPQSWFK